MVLSCNYPKILAKLDTLFQSSGQGTVKVADLKKDAELITMLGLRASASTKAIITVLEFEFNDLLDIVKPGRCYVLCRNKSAKAQIWNQPADFTPRQFELGFDGATQTEDKTAPVNAWNAVELENAVKVTIEAAVKQYGVNYPDNPNWKSLVQWLGIPAALTGACENSIKAKAEKLIQDYVAEHPLCSMDSVIEHLHNQGFSAEKESVAYWTHKAVIALYACDKIAMKQSHGGKSVLILPDKTQAVESVSVEQPVLHPVFLKSRYQNQILSKSSLISRTHASPNFRFLMSYEFRKTTPSRTVSR